MPSWRFLARILFSCMPQGMGIGVWSASTRVVNSNECGDKSTLARNYIEKAPKSIRIIEGKKEDDSSA